MSKSIKVVIAIVVIGICLVFYTAYKNNKKVEVQVVEPTPVVTPVDQSDRACPPAEPNCKG